MFKSILLAAIVLLVASVLYRYDVLHAEQYAELVVFSSNVIGIAQLLEKIERKHQ